LAVRVMVAVWAVVVLVVLGVWVAAQAASSAASATGVNRRAVFSKRVSYLLWWGCAGPARTGIPIRMNWVAQS